jgi:HAD superfamily hydrolase (TIGR01509 family)
VKGVLFDYGLTLVSFAFPKDYLLAAMEEARQWLGQGPPSAQELIDNVLLPIEESLAELDGQTKEIDYLPFYDQAWRRAGFDLPGETLYRILDLEQRCWDRAVQPAPQAFEALDGLQLRGVAIGICSNAPFPPEMMRRQMRELGLAQKMDAIVLSSEVGRRKPDPSIFLAALDRLGMRAEETLFVGDQVREDYEGPRRVGMSAVICTALAKRLPPGGVATISNLGELAFFGG